MYVFTRYQNKTYDKHVILDDMTLFKFITMFSVTDSILKNILHIVMDPDNVMRIVFDTID